jgi:O-antigen/teichoic acid export membrane protein
MPLTYTAKGSKYSNAVYGIADYLALPTGMLIAAPFLLRHLGAAQYGVWILSSAAVSGGGIVSGSFGDAVIKYVAACRGRRDWSGIARIVQSIISINLSLGCILAVVVWFAAPLVTRHIIKDDSDLRLLCLQSLRIGSGLLLVKSIESVFSSTLRAFETYGSTVRIAICARAAILASAIAITRYGGTVVGIMALTLFISILAMVAQGLALRQKLGSFSPLPLWHQKTVADVASFGFFSWLQTLAAVVFGQVDRLFVGLFMGAPAVAYYGLCVQAAQPIHGLISSAMHFLFPHLSARYPIAPIAEIRRKVAFAIKVNFTLVCALSLPLIVCGKHIIAIWIGQSFSSQPLMYPIIVCSFALLAMNVTAHYALLAVGQVRLVTYLNLCAGGAMLLLMTMLIPTNGLLGAALARLSYGPITCLSYFQLRKIIWRSELTASAAVPTMHELTIAASGD